MDVRRMYSGLIATLIAAAAALVLFAAPVAAQGVSTTILEYDKDGRVIGIKRSEGAGEAAARPTEDEEEADAPRPRQRRSGQPV